jgi:hypothetical protein
MTQGIIGRSKTRKFFLVIAGGLALQCGAANIVFAQHGGGHFSGGTHAGAPHVAAAPAPHVAPMRTLGAPAAGAASRGFVATPPPLRLVVPPAMNRPILGNHVILPPGAPASAPHTIIGFPPSGRATGTLDTHGSHVLSFSGEGHEIWQETRANGPASDGHTLADEGPVSMHGGAAHFPRRPVYPLRPRFPIFPGTGFGFGFGAPFFGFGLGFNSFWGPSCGPYWGWGFGCNMLPFYDYGYGYGNYGYSPSENLEGQIENQNAPLIYGNPSGPGLGYAYGGGERELVELYLKDGSVYNVTDYWLVSDQLHFTTIDANAGQPVEHAIDFDRLDLQKTIDVNTQRGFRFVLRNEPVEQYMQDHPDGATAIPETGPAGPLQPPAPAQPEPPPQAAQP